MGQGFPPTQVGITEARSANLRREIQLSGTVQSRKKAVVACTVAGQVLEVLAQEGDRVEKGQPLLRLDPAVIKLRVKEAEANLDETEARLKLAENQLSRADELFKTKVFSSQQFDDSRYQVQALEGRKANLNALIEQSQLDLYRATIRAPFNGVITAKMTEIGQWLGVGGQTFEIVAVDDLEVVVDAPERFFGLIGRGNGALIQFDAFEAPGFEGKVDAVIPQANQARSFPIKVRFDNGGRTVPTGILAKVVFRAGTPYTATIVPKDAIIPQGKTKQLFVLDGEQKVTPVEVETGIGAGQWIEVLGDIQPGQKVVTLGNERLRPGQAVQASVREYDLP